MFQNSTLFWISVKVFKKLVSFTQVAFVKEHEKTDVNRLDYQ